MERTLLAVKPDGVKRGLAGEIIRRFENVGLKIVGMKMVWIDKDFASRHYNKDETWLRKVGANMLKFYGENGKDPGENLGTRDELELGKKIQEWLFEYVTSGPVIAVVLEGAHVVDVVKKHIGATSPLDAQVGTIRGDFAYDSPDAANFTGRAIRNMIHCSGNKEEAEFEIKLWFKDSELYEYDRQ